MSETEKSAETQTSGDAGNGAPQALYIGDATTPSQLDPSPVEMSREDMAQRIITLDAQLAAYQEASAGDTETEAVEDFNDPLDRLDAVEAKLTKLCGVLGIQI